MDWLALGVQGYSWALVVLRRFQALWAAEGLLVLSCGFLLSSVVFSAEMEVQEGGRVPWRLLQRHSPAAFAKGLP